ncbi:MAG: glutamate-5-semialdehyde dehydrogenase [Cyclobacteriaceae bacterium]|nr:glutamate-5-semialdehyde dehydrogenase [Cyclobacteriaceae bacterium]MDH5249386.1 glutamate-5-semialdehyde dehydrogenase [Cyclobacteriaceae bacterium]
MSENIFKQVQDASRKLGMLSENKINQILLALAAKTTESIAAILEANQKDLDRMPANDPKYDRLKLTEQRIRNIAGDIENVSRLPSPLGIRLERKELENGLLLEKITVPLGVIGIIYEARPNVTFDVFALCLKSGNACILKGGRDAEHSNKQIVSLIKDTLTEQHENPDIVTLLPSDRSATEELLHAVGFVDVIIPRGSQQLIDYVRDNSKVPVIETGAGIVHAYFDSTGDIQKGTAIVFNSKTRRVSVCNALDCLIVHESRLADLPALTTPLADKNVQLYADEKAFSALDKTYPASLLSKAQETHFGTEFLDYKMSIKTVSNIAEALDHIFRYGSKHSEVIIADDENTITHFLTTVDAAAVYANASTAFTDGAQFGLGAEIGISTQKLHARGPMALREMTSYKWLIKGNGTIRIP